MFLGEAFGWLVAFVLMCMVAVIVGGGAGWLAVTILLWIGEQLTGRRG